MDFDIGISSSLKVDDNFQLDTTSAGTSTILDNRLTFNLSSVTGVQDFNVTSSIVYRYASIPGLASLSRPSRTISEFEDPTIRFSYTRDGFNSKLSINGRYRNVDREFLDPFQIEKEDALASVNSTSGAFDTDGGTLTFRNIGLTYQTGINDPLGFTLGLNHDDKSYSNLTNTTRPLFDNQSDSVDLTATFKISPVTQLRLQTGLTDFSTDDTANTERRTLNYSAGVVQDINPVLVVDAQLGWTTVDTDTNAGSSQRSGATGAVKLTQTMNNGTAFASLDSTLNQNGSRTSLRFGRNLQLPSGTLNASLGAARTPAGNTQWIAAVAYSHQLKTSDISVSLNRAVSTTAASQDVIDTRLSVGYGHEIDNDSRLDLSVNWGKSENDVVGGGGTSITRSNLRASYTRSLTQDWDVTGGVLVRTRDDTSAGSASSNSLFLTLDRKFNYRP
ncbi:MAG: hypothetical protein WBA90_06300 [Albidovulum sp.]